MSMSNSVRSTTAVDDQFILHPDDAKVEVPTSVFMGNSVPMMWRPITTAPKNGTWIMAWRGSTDFGHHNPMVIVRWSDHYLAWVWPAYPYDPWTDLGRQHADQLIEDGEMFEVGNKESFTHWMPLLEPPVVFDEGEKA